MYTSISLSIYSPILTACWHSLVNVVFQFPMLHFWKRNHFNFAKTVSRSIQTDTKWYYAHCLFLVVFCLWSLDFLCSDFKCKDIWNMNFVDDLFKFVQGLFVTFSSRDLSWSKRLKLKQCLTKRHLIGRADWHYILKQTICLRWRYCCVNVVKILVCYVGHCFQLF